MADDVLTHADPCPPDLLPPEPPDGTWLHVPDLHGTGYADVMRRDDLTAYGDSARALHHERWYSYHRRTWIPWADAVRLGAASERVLRLESSPPESVAARARMWRERAEVNLAAALDLLALADELLALAGAGPAHAERMQQIQRRLVVQQ